MTQKDIHHRCFCTGQEFTFNEWCEYLEDKENSNSTVHTFGKYMFNINDICKNPDTEIEYNKWNDVCYFSIKVCQSDNLRWTYGYSYNFHNSGGGSGASYAVGNKYVDSYETKKEAILSCLYFLKNNAIHTLKDEEHGFMDDDGNFRSSSHVRKIKAIITFIDKQILCHKYSQLTLF